MNEQQIKDCGKIMSTAASALFEEHADVIIGRVEEVQSETDGGKGQVTVPLRVEITWDGKELLFSGWIDWKKTISQRFSVEPVTYNPKTEQLSLPLAGSSEDASVNQQSGLKLVGSGDAVTAIDKDSFYARVCGKGEEPLQLVESELDQYFASESAWGSYQEWLDFVDGSNGEVAAAIMSNDQNRDDFIAEVKSTLYPVGGTGGSTEPAAEKKTRKPRKAKEVPTAPATPERCEFIHEKIGLQCIHNKGHEGKHGLNLCKHMHEDEVQFCILESGHAEEHKFADPATLS